jgi:hypothetical protein
MGRARRFIGFLPGRAWYRPIPAEPAGNHASTAINAMTLPDKVRKFQNHLTVDTMTFLSTLRVAFVQAPSRPADEDRVHE